MTTLADGRPVGAPERADRGPSDVLARVAGTRLLGRQPHSGYVDPPALVRRTDGQILQLTPLLYAILDAVDGRRDLDGVAAAAGAATGRHLHADDVRTLVDGKLRPLGLVCGPDGSHPPLKRANPLLALRPRIVVSKPELTRRITAPFAVLFHPVLVVLSTAAFAAVAFWVLFDKGLAGAAHDAFTSPGLLLAVFVITVVSAGFHEFGHAAALRRGGGTPGAMGAGLYLVWPAFYTDVTDSYRLARRDRLRTDLGGLYFNALVSLVMFGLWAAVRWDGLLLVIAAQILQMIRQLPPMVRFDGYHILADITGVPDLFHRIGPTLRSFLPRRYRPAHARELKLWARVVVTAWVLLLVPLLLVTVTLAVLALPRIIGTTAHSVSVQAGLLGARADAGDVTGVLVKALAIAGLVVPVAGIVYLLLRIARRIVVNVWRRTAGAPRRRAVAGVAALAVAAGLAYAWWPGGGTYAPIRPGERGTVQGALHGALPQLAAAAGSVPAAGLYAGQRETAQTLWPATDPVLPTAAHPKLAVVLVPRDRSADAPTWVFPFDRPAPPGLGDNQALAVVSRDGGTAYDVAFALVWADGDTVLNRNESYAFASCTGCRAMAVSFQVVLVVGQAHVVALQNIAAAVSYHCVRCVTEALATQLVLTVPDDLSRRAQRRLDKLWAEIAAFGKDVSGLSRDQIEDRLRDYERQIVAIVEPETVTSNEDASTGLTPTPTPSLVPTATVTPTATGSAAPTATSSSSPSASASSTASPSGAATSSPSTSSSPSPSGTSSPSSEPTPSEEPTATTAPSP